LGRIGIEVEEGKARMVEGTGDENPLGESEVYRTKRNKRPLSGEKII